MKKPHASRAEPRLFDVQLVSQGLAQQDLESLRFFGLSRAIVPPSAALPEPSAKKLLADFDRVTQGELERLSKAGIKAQAMLGIHPRAIPRRGVPEVLSALPGYFKGAKVAAVGPIGFYAETGAEEELFKEQLLLARRLKVPVVVATPTRAREAVTRRTLQALLASGLSPSKVLIDGATPRTLAPIRACGFSASIMLHPDGLPAERAVQLIAKAGGTRLCLSSHAGDGASDIVSLARLHSLLSKEGHTDALVAAVTFKNAEGFFGRAEAP